MLLNYSIILNKVYLKYPYQIDNDLLASRFVHVHTICSHFFKIKIIFSVHMRDQVSQKV